MRDRKGENAVVWLYKAAVAVLTPIVQLLFWVKVTGKENIPQGAALVCANHTSFLDPVVLAIGVGLKIPFRFMAKRELFKNKLFAAFLRKIGVIPVNREAVDLATIRASLKVLKDGDRLMMFPEGTRIPEEKACRENVKMGAGMLASRAKVPIIPVYISGKKRVFCRTRIVIGRAMQAMEDANASNNENYMNTAMAVFDEIMRLGRES